MSGGIIGWVNSNGAVVSPQTGDVVRCVHPGHAHDKLIDPAVDVVAVKTIDESTCAPDAYVIRENPYEDRYR
jgi:hypothetical protein